MTRIPWRAVIGVTAALGAALALTGCNSEPSNEELIKKVNDLPSNNPGSEPPPDNPRAEAMKGGTKPGGSVKPGG